MTPNTTTREFCRRHRSHFCPCVRPKLYAEGMNDVPRLGLENIDSLDQAKRAWRKHGERGRHDDELFDS
jgi:hypothetical protein